MTYIPDEEALRYLIGAKSRHASVAIRPHEAAGGQNSIDQLLKEKVGSLATILGDIQHKIDRRYVLSSDVQSLIDQHYFYIKTKLLELRQWPIDGVRAIEQRRSGLEGTLDTLLNEKRREHVQCWQDIAELKREFWKWFKLYSDVAQRAQFIQLHGRDTTPTDR